MSVESNVSRFPCPMCGKSIPVAARKCRFCGEELKPTKSDEAVATLIPYKNQPALIAYYVGILGMLPCFPLGIAAFILGIMGLRKVKQHPEVHGTVHAWIGIVLGFLFGGLWTVLTVAGIVGAVMSRAR